jgi:hypothetical protein
MKSTFKAALLFLLVVSTNASGKELVREFKGDSNMITAAFTVESPWILDWYLFGDYEQLVALSVQLVDANTGYTVGEVLNTKAKGNGIRLFRQGGKFQLRISSTLARWGMKVEQLTEEEAELYTPRR